MPHCLPMLASNFGNAASFLGLWPLGFPPGIHHVSRQPPLCYLCSCFTTVAALHDGSCSANTTGRSTSPFSVHKVEAT
ncbi:hypothetical protein BD309DRAFT_970970 [Dichomitus squalens]|nr:hypothetical protein BD309DRAFT_970970 [Dichomitus squalens]